MKNNKTITICQTSEILRYLEKHGHITSWEAIVRFGATRLSGIIYSLKKRGYPITASKEKVKTRYGFVTEIAVYHLEKNNE
jgi:hypothetical protein